MKKYNPGWRDYGEYPGNYCATMYDDPNGEYCRYSDHLKEMQAREFSEEEKAVFMNMLADHDPDLEKWPGEMIAAIESLEKKVLGYEASLRTSLRTSDDPIDNPNNKG